MYTHPGGGGRGGGAGGIPFISPHGEAWVPWAPLNKAQVGFSGSIVLNRVHNFTLQHCEQRDNHLSRHLSREKEDETGDSLLSSTVPY